MTEKQHRHNFKRSLNETIGKQGLSVQFFHSKNQIMKVINKVSSLCLARTEGTFAVLFLFLVNAIQDLTSAGKKTKNPEYIVHTY